MKEKKTHAGTKNMQNQARAVSNGSPATSEEIEKRRRKAAAKKKRSREQKINRTTTEYRRKDVPYSYRQIASLTVCCVLFLALAVVLVGSESVLKKNITQMNSLQVTYESLLASNNELEAKITSEIDVNEIYEIATQKMGMTYPKKSQVIKYKKTESEHVKQNEDIPKD